VGFLGRYGGQPADVVLPWPASFRRAVIEAVQGFLKEEFPEGRHET
jgi:hypothetical protein